MMTGKDIIKTRVQAKIDAAGRSAHVAATRDATRLYCWQQVIEELVAELLDKRGKGND